MPGTIFPGINYVNKVKYILIYVQNVSGKTDKKSVTLVTYLNVVKQ